MADGRRASSRLRRPIYARDGPPVAAAANSDPYDTSTFDDDRPTTASDRMDDDHIDLSEILFADESFEGGAMNSTRIDRFETATTAEHDFEDSFGYVRREDIDFSAGPSSMMAADRRRERVDSNSEEDEEDADGAPSIMRDDVFRYGELGDAAYLLPGTGVRILRKGELWLRRNDTPTAPPFGIEYYSTWGEKNNRIRWTPFAPSSREADHFALPVSSSDAVKLAPRMEHLRGCKEPLQFFRAIVTDEILERVLKFTNDKSVSLDRSQELDEAADDEERARILDDHRTFGLGDLLGFIGACLMLGEQGASFHSMDQLFSVDMSLVRPLLIRAFSRNRFKNLQRCLRFDDTINRPAKMPRLHKISDVFDRIIASCGSCFVPGRFLTVDEALLDFRGRVVFKMYIPNKPAKYGIKINVLADARTNCILRAEIYAGKEDDHESSDDENEEDGGQNDDDEEGEEGGGLGSTAELVLRLVADYERTGRVIVVDRGFTSVGLALELRKRGLDCLGTIRGSARGIPAALKRVNLHQIYGKSTAAKLKCERKIYEAYGEFHPEDGRASSSNRRPTALKGESRTERPPTEASATDRPRLVIRRLVGDEWQIDQTQSVVDSVVSSVIDGIASNDENNGKRRRSKNKKKAEQDPIDEAYAAFLFSEAITICKYVVNRAKETAPVYVLSTVHHDDTICSEKDGRPAMIKAYNVTKPGVDVMDQMVSEYTSRRTCFRWPVRVWNWLMDTAALSAYQAFVIANQGSIEASMPRRDFLRKLSWALMKPLVHHNESVEPMRTRDRAIVGIIGAVQKYRELFKPRRFSLDDSLSVRQLMAKAATPIKASNSNNRTSTSTPGQSQRSSSSTPSTPAGAHELREVWRPITS